MQQMMYQIKGGFYGKYKRVKCVVGIVIDGKTHTKNEKEKCKAFITEKSEAKINREIQQKQHEEVETKYDKI